VADPRVEQYAKLLVERCVDVQPGWQVLVIGTPLARPLVDEVVRLIARRGAYALVRLEFALPSEESIWAGEAPEQLLAELPGIEAYQYDHVDCYISIRAPENTRVGSGVDAERYLLRRRAFQPYLARFINFGKPWVGCDYPTHALAQDAGMTLHEFEEFLYGAVLIDWDATRERMRRIADRFDAARHVRLVAHDTDLRLSLEGRRAEVDALGANMPGGEFFFSPVEDSAEGIITFSEYPACYAGHQVVGARLRFEGGRVVEAEAEADEEFLLATLGTDEGARRLGELGVGCNPGIQAHTRNTLFDEKIEGTAHLAVGQGFGFLGGKNVSAVHWDMVKDLRRGGRIELDGEVVQDNGKWLVDG
jgi:aminopeptidase